ncbi:putative secreted protein [Leucobacter sp. 7(1)]|uniref:HtaA domain-containing protein n=1 Tax=Leucobacter sp. 7(1) TaxID=1255613 RepID=UPI00097F06DF|nr:HtaA domain-containing protein [Leucobacter sp. 7(1)]SJN08257.1 putative secreted protein [Leucobacter sp. 7(1)]
MQNSHDLGRRTARRTLALVGGGLIAAGALLVPTAATAAPAVLAQAAPVAATAETSCTVSTGMLTWGVKESFRSYISGSIANGEWTVSEDMRYETPSFIWDQVTGAVSSDLTAGNIAFTGAIHFTGHSGAMELDLSDPKIEFTDDDTAYLTLTIGATDAADAGGEATAETLRAAKIDLTDAVSAGGSELSLESAIPRLTAEGAAALNGEYGSYVAGEELDPIALTATVTGCELGESAAVVMPETELPGDPTPAPGVTDTESAAPSIPWLPIGIGAVALLVIGVTGGMLLGGRKRPSAQQSETDPGTDTH